MTTLVAAPAPPGGCGGGDSLALRLRAVGACSSAVQWVATQPDAETAWAACDRADWLLWIAVKLCVDRRLVVRATCACARTSLRYLPDPEGLRAIEAAEAWCRGEVTIDQVRAASAGASAGADAAAARKASLLEMCGLVRGLIACPVLP